jgi:hypothetical protein
VRIARLIPALALLVQASVSWSSNGVIEINQARATQGGVTSGDTPGFPVTLRQTGSYVLTGSLTPGTASAIEIISDHVTLDLNGFSIIGPDSGSGIGIDASGENVVVKNGTVTRMGGSGVVVGLNSRVDGVRAIENRGDGIRAGDGSVVVDSTAAGNLLQGIAIASRAISEGSTSFGNAADVHKTFLLFPFTTNQAGFDTSISIANTTAAPAGLGPINRAGACTLHYFGNTNGGAAPPSQSSTSIAAGQSATLALSAGGTHGFDATPGFQGYVIAECGFPLAHGFAFVSNLGTAEFATSYLATVIEEGRALDLPEGD